MKGISVSEEMNSLFSHWSGRCIFCLSKEDLPPYYSDAYNGDKESAWVADAKPNIFLNTGYTEHRGYTVVFFEHMTNGSRNNMIAIFEGSADSVNEQTSPISCFQSQGAGIHIPIRLPEDNKLSPSLGTIPVSVEGAIKPIWYVRKD